ncbi:unnamed protein product [Vitrella brassicaformis CCMP3155]|uniref:Uncharacterized protein n=1 Tax=Vitrella brassicaformis (strain CCMP3155) TaxID=1169540 RepID=A0A0G4H179_VITBC|nr:unnamed protein product [Vitrella brassicaformis CCMP3155]|eukprot:CEM37312.1 unnamed protein product [Vitrella brassicaformis CCMP3155]
MGSTRRSQVMQEAHAQAIQHMTVPAPRESSPSASCALSTTSIAKADTQSCALSPPSGEGAVPEGGGSDGCASTKARSAGSAKERGVDNQRKEDKDALAAGSCEQSDAAAAASSSWFEAANPPSAS